MSKKQIVNEQVRHFFSKRADQLLFEDIVKLVGEGLAKTANHDIVAGQSIRRGRVPVNMGNTAEGIFVIGLIAAMQGGSPISKDDIVSVIQSLYSEYRKGSTEAQQILQVMIPSINDFSSHFPQGINVNLKIALNAPDMVTLFLPLGELPDTLNELQSQHEYIITHLLDLKSDSTDSWAMLSAIILNTENDDVERQKALTLLQQKLNPVVKEFYQIANSVAAFWNQSGGGKRGYEDIVADTVNQLNSDNLSKKITDSLTTLSVVADGISANLATTADAFVKIGDDDSGTLLFSYSLKKGSDQIFQTGRPGSGRQTSKSGAVGGGIEYMFLKFGLQQNAMPIDTVKFYNCIDNSYTKPQSNPGAPCGSAPSSDEMHDPKTIQVHIDVWNDTALAFANSINEKLNEEKYKIQMLGGLAIMITKTKEELDMEYVNLGTSAETTIRAFPGLIAKYSRHFEFDSSRIETGRILEEYGNFVVNQPTVYTSIANSIQRESICLFTPGVKCPEDKFEVKVSEIKKSLSKGSEYLADFFDANSAERLFELKPEMKVEFDAMVEKATPRRRTLTNKALEKIRSKAFKMVVSRHLNQQTSSNLVYGVLSENDILDMVIKKLNSMLPKPQKKVFAIRLKHEFSRSSQRHTWRTLLEKKHGMTDIMTFVEYAKYLKYDAGEGVLKEIEDILDASVQTLEREEEKLKLRKV